MSTGSAKRLLAALNRTPAKHETVEDGPAQDIIRMMQRRGVVGHVAGVPDPADHKAEAERAARRRIIDHIDRVLGGGQDEEANEPQPATAIDVLANIFSAESGPSTHMPLNGTQVLRAALGGASGTINGKPA